MSTEDMLPGLLPRQHQEMVICNYQYLIDHHLLYIIITFILRRYQLNEEERNKQTRNEIIVLKFFQTYLVEISPSPRSLFVIVDMFPFQ